MGVVSKRLIFTFINKTIAWDETLNTFVIGPGQVPFFTNIHFLCMQNIFKFRVKVNPCKTFL